ncbi:MAG TPA: hypothetical protein VLJ37_07005 [bacterium]|nr:hypothetical protein [bacterium]
MKLTRKIKKVGEALKDLVLAEYRHPVEVSVREEPAPLGLTVITACNPKAHPGTGMKRVLMDEDGTTYGIHGEKDFAALARLKGWTQAPPDPKEFLRLVNLAQFEGIALLQNPDPRFEKNPRELVFRFFRTEHPSGRRIEVVIRFREST